MNTRTRLTPFAAALAAFLLFAAGQAFARSLPADSSVTGSADLAQQLPNASVLQSNGPSLSEAIERVRRKYPGGRIIDAKTVKRGNREVHEIKVLTSDNKVRTERVNGRRTNNRG
ncbi:MAG: PepSY domain-containing protein [Woeseiaceae bacterium]|nr:PepSY domain-containing protein [Woeseiaceae bacterium]